MNHFKNTTVMIAFYEWKTKKINMNQMHKINGTFCLTPGRRSSSLHAEKVSWMYQSGNKHENYENRLTNDFVDVQTGNQTWKLRKYYCWNTKNFQNHEGSFIFLTFTLKPHKVVALKSREKNTKIRHF